MASGAVPTSNVEPQLGKQLGGTTVTNNPTASPTDAMVNRLAEAERAVKNERRSQWLNMNQSSASNVLANLGADLPSHLKDAQGITPAAEVLAGTMGQPVADGPNDALLRRMCEVASRRVARKRGVAVETPEAKIVEGKLVVNLTYVDDGRVLDTPEDLSSAFEHAIQTEVALKGYDMAVEIVLSCMKDGEVTTIGQDAEEDDEEMFACEVCDGLVKESDPKCPHCGAIFEEEEEEVVEQTRKGPQTVSFGSTRSISFRPTRTFQRWTTWTKERWTAGTFQRRTSGAKERWTAGTFQRWTAGAKERWTAGTFPKVDLPKVDLLDQRKVDRRDLPKVDHLAADLWTKERWTAGTFQR